MADKNELNLLIDEEYLFLELNEKYLTQTTELLNSEWPINFERRYQSLKNCIPTSKTNSNTKLKQNSTAKYNLPISLILVDIKFDKVIGHSSFDLIATKENCLKYFPYLKSLIIDKSLRGRGLGKKMMQLSERYFIDNYKNNSENKPENANYDFIYLITSNQHRFYQSIGYEKIDSKNCFFVKRVYKKINLCNIFKIINESFRYKINGFNNRNITWYRKMLI